MTIKTQEAVKLAADFGKGSMEEDLSLIHI